MKNLLRLFVLYAITTLVLSSCSFFTSSTTTAPQNIAPKIAGTPTILELVKIELTVQADTSIPFTKAGDIVKYIYTIKRTDTTGTILSAGVAGSVTITGVAAICPEVITIGNKDGVFDANESLQCTSSYVLTQPDVDKGSIVTLVTATVSGVSSAPFTATVNITKPVVAGSALKLTKTATPATYFQAGQKITYTYTITNTGTVPLGPAQFTVTDVGIPAPIICGGSTTLATTATISCTSEYTVTQTDMGGISISTSATASGGGVTTEPAGIALTKGGVAPAPANINPANLTAGSTVSHTVSEGEWLWQIARCYGADPGKALQANPQLGNPAMIEKGVVISVPNIGSAGKIYGTPCVKIYTVLNGDTWNSIAQANNADANVMQKANANILVVGKTVIIPLNSASTIGSGVSSTTSTTAPVSGNCTDLTRNLRLTTKAQPSVTHFSVCGALLASGNMNIDTIKVYQRPEDVGLGGLSQDITLPAIDTSTPLSDTNSLIVADMNYDGNDDFRIVREIPAAPNIPYVYYLFDPTAAKFVYNESYGVITSPEFPGNNEIRSKWRDGAARWGVDTYKIANNTPTLTQREVWEAINATQAKHTITLRNADGTNTVTLDETIPLPVQ